ncbi:PREDICTED: uncharacterized protein LOC101301643 [Fragaria vesca subsp. vesca]|uniref:uncharacterized protein LOC101301643 n=1 Tax=Fragaria vesca subsp. vesca TaxID=101020 RepID=UPI0002C2ECE9|nr:PREDICTED: uncharacterized protein LOC101301643 [Fragaria vesca subsp. vesca]XP_011457556.1 PREDICTED: uncharacterized protein LOC101301643 [Fragaria vesca subsp. vesca]
MPDFTEVPDLEVLALQRCTSLVEVHPSLGFLKKLRCLYMESCTSIESLPPFTTLESLQILRLSGCSGLMKFPEIEGNMKSLLELHVAETSIEELPPSIEHFTGLTMLNLTHCKNLLRLPNNIGCLTSLKILGLTGCPKIDEIPENMNGMKSLETLCIGGTSIRELSIVAGIKNLRYLSCQGCICLVSESCKDLALSSKLIELDLSYCNLMDGEFLNDFSSLISLTSLHLSGNCFVWLPESISHLSKLETLHLSNCRQLQLLPKKFPLSLRHVYAQECSSLTDYPNQIKVLNSSESGVTIINSLDSAAPVVSQSFRSLIFPINAGESIQLRVTHKHTEGKQVDHAALTTLKQVPLLSASDVMSMLARDEISEWFTTISTRNPISIPMPQNQADGNRWKEIAACAIFAFKGHTALSLIEPDPDFLNYSYQITWETDDVRLEPDVLELDSAELGRFGLSSHLLVIFSISRSVFPLRELIQSTVVRAKFETTNPSMVVQKCGMRLVYDQDDGWFTRVTEDDVICLDEVGIGATIRDSDWLSQSFKWEKIVPPLEEETTVLVLRKNLESVLPRYLEALNSYSRIFKFNIGGSPGWFHEGVALWSNSAVMSMELPKNLHKSKKWMGFAIFASLVEEVGQTIKEDNYLVQAILITGDKFVTVVEQVFDHVEPLSEEHHHLLVIYIPAAQIPEELLTQTSSTALDFEIMIVDSPHVKVHRCGFRIVYQEDIQGFSDTIIRCMQRDNSLESYDKLVVEEWIELIQWEGAHLTRMTERDSRTPREKYFDLRSRKYRYWDWSDPHHPVYCRFKGVNISKLEWFMPFINQRNSAEIQLPLNVFDDDNWLGFAVCFQLSGDQYPNSSLGSTDPDSEDHILSFRLDSDVAWQGLFDSDMHFSLQPSGYDATWFYYTPRTAARKEVWRQCKLARITVWLSTPRLAVQGCALRLLFKEDVEHLVESLTLAEYF